MKFQKMEWIMRVALLGSLVGCGYTYVDTNRHQSDRYTPSSPYADDPYRGTDDAMDEADASFSPSEECDAFDVDPFRELLVVDRSVFQNSDITAPTSFPSVMNRLAGSDAAASALVLDWLESWATTTNVAGVPVTKREGAKRALIDPWREKSGGTMALRDAPFRPIAVVNRPDLGGAPCTESAGEVRVVYTAVDLQTGRPLPMTVIVEVPYSNAFMSDEWAGAWHKLGGVPFGAKYNTLLSKIVQSALRTSDPESIRIRTNEQALGEAEGLPWEMREFQLSRTNGVRLQPRLLRSTPQDALRGGAVLDGWLSDHEASLLRGEVPELPITMQAATADMPSASFGWPATRVSEAARRTFSASTCNGCHGGERPSDTLMFQHIAPDMSSGYSGSGQGETRVSTYLYNPVDGSGELKQRATVLRKMACTKCTSAAADPGEGRYGACR